MAVRNAISTIRGYFYQFDYSIIKVLELENDTDTICIEGLEDVDINNSNNITLHQCKCYEGSEYNHSKIAPAIRWMLRHYSENKENDYQYCIYGKFKSGQSKFSGVNLDFIKKNICTYNEKGVHHILFKELNLTDNDLKSFIHKLRININADSYEEQEKKVLNIISSSINCTKYEAELYYCNALSIIKKIATNHNTSERIISRKDFINQIKNVNNQFDIWLLNKKGIESFARAIRKKYFAKGANVSPFSRFFLIKYKENDNLAEIKSLMLLIAQKYSKFTKGTPDQQCFCPYIYLDGIKDKQLIEIKKLLFNENIKFSDGFDFFGADFSCKYFTKSPNKKDPIQIKIINKQEYLDTIFANVNTTIEIYQFYIDVPFFENDIYKHIKIPFKNISDIFLMV